MVCEKKWPACRVTGFDIDQELVDHCESRFEGLGIFRCVDTLRTNLQDIRDMINNNSQGHTITLALSNPPFGTTEAGELAPDLLDCLFVNNLTWKDGNGCYRVLNEAAFFLRNLELLDNGGYVAILLPEGLVSGVKTESFRRFLIRYTQIRLVFSLPINSFDSCEARISLVVAQKNAVNTRRAAKIPLCYGDGNIESRQMDVVKQGDLLSRMDPGYHIKMASLKNENNDFKPLGKYLDSCARGYGFYGNERHFLTRDGDLEYIHSVDIRDLLIRESPHRLMVDNKLGNQHPKALIRKGDLLLVRVGKGCAGRCSIVIWQTNAFASDCVYVLRSKRIDPYYLCLYLNTAFAKKYLDACTRGVCSRYITKDDLMTIPIYLPDQKVISRLSRAFKNILVKTSLSCVPKKQLAKASILTNDLNILISRVFGSGNH